MKENSKRFQLAYASPVFNWKIINQIGAFGEKYPSLELIFNNKPLNINDPNTAAFFNLLYQPSSYLINHQVSLQQWNAHWKQSREATASSYSGLHYGHYIAHCNSPIVAASKCQLVNLAISNRTPLKRWLNGVSIMLEKSLGNIQVYKLRAILLLEADFNVINKIIFNTRLMPSLKKFQSIPKELIGGRRS